MAYGRYSNTNMSDLEPESSRALTSRRYQFWGALTGVATVIPMTLADHYILYLDKSGRNPTGLAVPFAFYLDPVISGPAYCIARLFGWHWRNLYDVPQLLTILLVNCILWGAATALLLKLLIRLRHKSR